MPITDQRASGRARCSSRGASSRSPWASRTSASRWSAVRLAGRGVGVAVQVDRLRQLALGEVEVAHQQRRLPDQRRREGHPAQRADLLGAAAQVLGLAR